MVYLLLSIFFATLLTVIFKVFPIYKVHLLSAIVINYLVCYFCGSLLMGATSPFENYNAAWFPYAVALGVIFIFGFNLIGNTVARFGIAMATLMQKMSIVLSVVFAVLYFQESLGFLKVLGLLLAIISIAFYNSNVYNTRSSLGGMIFVPIMVWLVSGIIEIILLFTQKTGLIGGTDATFTSHIFLFAGIFGLIWTLISGHTKELFKGNNLLAGLLLGVPNYFSIYYLVKLLDTDWEGSVALPINNIGILVSSALIGVLLFKETHSKLQWIGISIAIASILILSF